MDLSQFEIEWKEYSIKKGKQDINFRDMLVRSRGICTVGGHKAVNFEAANEDVDPMFLRPVTNPDGSSNCFRWDDDNQKWENIGLILLSNEWSAHQLKSKWKDCAIHIAESGKIFDFTDIFSDCYGERHDGVSFVGKGIFDGKNILIRLDCDKHLENYYNDQVCEKFNEKTDEWEFWGMLVKRSLRPII